MTVMPWATHDLQKRIVEIHERNAMTTTAIDQRTAVPTHWTVDPNKSCVEFAVKTFKIPNPMYTTP